MPLAMVERADKPQAVVLLGPTGSGKTPLGERLEAKGLGGRRCHHFDFGTRLRRVATGALRPAGLTDGDLAAVRQALDEGALLEDEQFPIAEAILRDFVAEREPGPGDLVVLDGLPRHEGQAEALDAFLRVIAVIELRCAPECVLARIEADAGGDRGGRRDDREQAVRRRLRDYAQRTQPLARFYRLRGTPTVALEVRADTTPAEAFAALERSTACWTETEPPSS